MMLGVRSWEDSGQHWRMSCRAVVVVVIVVDVVVVVVVDGVGQPDDSARVWFEGLRSLIWEF